MLTASFAIVCAGLSLIALLFGSWYIQQYASDNGAKWLLILTTLLTLLSCTEKKNRNLSDFNITLLSFFCYSFIVLWCLGYNANNKFTSKIIRYVKSPFGKSWFFILD